MGSSQDLLSKVSLPHWFQIYAWLARLCCHCDEHICQYFVNVFLGKLIGRFILVRQEISKAPIETNPVCLEARTISQGSQG